MLSHVALCTVFALHIHAAYKGSALFSRSRTTQHRVVLCTVSAPQRRATDACAALFLRSSNTSQRSSSPSTGPSPLSWVCAPLSAYAI
eukprot:397757-Rhodomonas_salina.1